MIVAGISVGLLYAILGVWTEKKIFNPLTVFSALWAIVIFLSSLHLYNLYEATTTTYAWICAGLLAFGIGYYCAKFGLKNKRFILKGMPWLSSASVGANELRYKVVYFLLILSIFFYFKDFVTVAGRLMGGFDLYNIQKLLQNNDDVFTRSSVETLIRFFFIQPFAWISIPIAVVDFWIGKRDKRLFTLTIFMIFLRIFTSGGRAAFIQLGFYFVSIYSLSLKMSASQWSKRARSSLKKNRRLFIVLTAVAVVVLAVLTYSRAGQNALKTIYYDFAMQPNMLEIWAKKAEESVGLGLGAASLNGFLYSIDYVLRNTVRLVLPESYQAINTLISSTDTAWQWIGNGVSANAYVSVFWFLYVDGRTVGIIIGMFIYGFFARQSYVKMRRNPSQRNMGLYSIILIGIFYTFGRMQFTQYAYVLGVIYMAFFMYKKSNIATEVVTDYVNRAR